jgi:RimJ/RimL family protein N-acetyltransferase
VEEMGCHDAEWDNPCVGLPIETPRLRIRPFTPVDAAHIHEAYSDSEVGTPLEPGGPTNGLEDTIDVVDHVIAFHKEHGTGPWAVEELASSRVIGDCGLFPADRSDAGLDGDLELAFRLRRASWGLGYATEAAGAVIAYGFEDLGASRIVADVDADNAASSRVLEKLGFVVVGTGAERGTSLLYYALDAPRMGGSGV